MTVSSMISPSSMVYAKGTSGLPTPVDDQGNGVPVQGAKFENTQALTTTAVTYTTGQVIGSLITFTGVTAAADAPFLLQDVLINCKSTQTIQLDLIFFSANPSGSTITNASALAVVTADFDKAYKAIHVTDWTALNTASMAQADNLARLMSPVSGTTSIYACLVARGSLASGTTSEIKVTIQTASV